MIDRDRSLGPRSASLLARLGYWGAVSIAVLAAFPAWAVSVDTTLTCPGPNSVGQSVPIHVRIENQDCTSVNVRLTSMLTAPNQNVAGTLIAGPKIVAQNVTVPAASCTPPFSPGVYDNQLQAPPAVPASFSGKVGALVLVSDASDGLGSSESETDTCILPEPTRAVQLGSGVLGLLILGRFRERRGRPRSE